MKIRLRFFAISPGSKLTQPTGVPGNSHMLFQDKTIFRSGA